MTASDEALRITVEIAGRRREVEVFSIGPGIPVIVDPELPPEELRVVGETSVRITGIGDTPTG